MATHSVFILPTGFGSGISPVNPSLFPNGSAALPAVSWINESSSGRYRIGAGNIGESILGVLKYDWNVTRLNSLIPFQLTNGTRRYRLNNNATNLLLETSNDGISYTTVGTFTSGGSLSLGGTLSSGTLISPSNGANITFPSSASMRINNVGQSNTYDIILADWGTTLSAEGISINNAAVLSLLSSAVGVVMIAVGTDNNVGIFALTGSGAPVIISDPGSIFTVTKDNGGTLNLYFDLGYKLQNNRGGARVVRIINNGSTS